MATIISPSILSADFARLGEEVNAVLAAGADWIHFDVMDNHYVPNLTIGPLVCEALRKAGVKAPIDVHLMVSPVDQLVPDFAKAGASYISFHPEATQHVDRTIQLIRDSGCKPGLVFNPATPLNWLDYVIEKIDLILVMSVNPGFGGQKFIPQALHKLTEARARIAASGRDIRLEIDGGVKVDNAAEIARAGADTFVSGSAIFGSGDYAAHHQGHARANSDGRRTVAIRRRDGRRVDGCQRIGAGQRWTLLVVLIVVIIVIIVRLGARGLGAAGLFAPAFTGTISGRVLTLGRALKTTMVLPVARSRPCSSNTLRTRPAISREQPTSRDSSCRLTLICMPSGWVIASGSPHRSMMACATRPVTSTKARSPNLRLVRSSRVANCVANSKIRPGLSAAICRKRG